MEEMQLLDPKFYGITSNKSHTDYSLAITSHGGIGDMKRSGSLVYYEYENPQLPNYSRFIELKDDTFHGATDDIVIERVLGFLQNRGETAYVYSPIPKIIMRSFKMSLSKNGEGISNGKVFYLRPFYWGYDPKIGDHIDKLIIEQITSNWQDNLDVNIHSFDFSTLVTRSQYNEILFRNRGKHLFDITIHCSEIERNVAFIRMYKKPYYYPYALRLLYIIHNDQPDQSVLDTLKRHFEVDMNGADYDLVSKFDNNPQFVNDVFKQ